MSLTLAATSFGQDPSSPISAGSFDAVEADEVEADEVETDDVENAVLRMEPYAKSISINEDGYPEATFGEGTVLIYVPAGTFSMGSADMTRSERPVHDVHLSGYWIGKYPVTNAQFEAFVDATGFVTDTEKPGAEGCYVYNQDERYFKPTPGRNWRDAFETLIADHPVSCVSWYDGQAYASWMSQQLGIPVGLPTEAQWEKAARGTDGRIFPWGNEPPDGTRANYCDSRFAKAYPGSHQGNPDLAVDDGYAGTAPVDAYPAGRSPYGLYDLAGNLTEWVFDLYEPYPEGPVSDPAGPAVGDDRCMRCGIWVGDAGLTRESIEEKHNLRAENRSRDDPRSSDDHLGIRIVASLSGVRVENGWRRPGVRAVPADEERSGGAPTEDPSSGDAEKPDLSGVEIVTRHVAGSVYMLEATRDVAGNVAVLIGEGGALLVDSQFSELAPLLRTALDELGVGPIRTIVNTHYHADHSEGNGMLAIAGGVPRSEVNVIAHANAVTRMAGRPVASRPDAVVDDELTIQFGNEEVRLIHLPRGHTDSDLVVHFVSTNVFHLGDLLNGGVSSFPSVDVGAGGTLSGLIRNLGVLIEQMPADARVIPGHYELTDREGLIACRDMVVETVEAVWALRDSGMNSDEIVAHGLPERYAGWGLSGYTNAESWIENILEGLEASERDRGM